MDKLQEAYPTFTAEVLESMPDHIASSKRWQATQRLHSVDKSKPPLVYISPDGFKQYIYRVNHISLQGFPFIKRIATDWGEQITSCCDELFLKLAGLPENTFLELTWKQVELIAEGMSLAMEHTRQMLGFMAELCDKGLFGVTLNWAEQFEELLRFLPVLK